MIYQNLHPPESLLQILAAIKVEFISLMVGSGGTLLPTLGSLKTGRSYKLTEVPEKCRMSNKECRMSKEGKNGEKIKWEMGIPKARKDPSNRTVCFQ